MRLVELQFIDLVLGTTYCEIKDLDSRPGLTPAPEACLQDVERLRQACLDARGGGPEFAA
jgi:hypothetical protein